MRGTRSGALTSPRCLRAVSGRPRTSLSYPETEKALDRQSCYLAGLDNSTYNSLNAFRFINASGAVVSVRWSMVPVQPFEPISTTEPGKAGKNYLFDGSR